MTETGKKPPQSVAELQERFDEISALPPLARLAGLEKFAEETGRLAAAEKKCAEEGDSMNGMLKGTGFGMAAGFTGIVAMALAGYPLSTIVVLGALLTAAAGGAGNTIGMICDIMRKAEPPKVSHLEKLGKAARDARDGTLRHILENENILALAGEPGAQQTFTAFPELKEKFVQAALQERAQAGAPAKRKQLIL